MKRTNKLREWTINCNFSALTDFESTPTFHHSGYITCSSQSSRFDDPDYIRWTVLWSFSLWSLLQSPFSYLLCPNTRPGMLFSNTLSVRSSLNVRDHVSYPYSTTGNIIVLYILIFKFLERCLDDVFGLIITWISCFKPTFLFNWLVNTEPKYLKAFIFHRNLTDQCYFMPKFQKFVEQITALYPL